MLITATNPVTQHELMATSTADTQLDYLVICDEGTNRSQTCKRALPKISAYKEFLVPLNEAEASTGLSYNK